MAKPLVVSMGEPAGVGPDIILQAFEHRQTFETPCFYVIGDAACFEARAQALGCALSLHIITAPEEAVAHFPNALPLIDIGPIDAVSPGTLNPENASAVIEAIRLGVQHIAEGRAAGLVTAPLHKAGLYGSGFQFPGHTEFLGALAADFFKPEGGSSQPVMMLVAEGLRVVPLTIHVALKDVPGLLHQELIIKTVQTLAKDLTMRFGLKRPHIVLTGLNPHAGEDGTMGREEIDVIIPAIKALQAEGLSVAGPVSADTCFHAEARAGYDAVVAMYHDQALIPIKTLAFDEGVNVTLGLPFIRTSPDHGTALSLAGLGKARPDSFLNALRLAAEMATYEADESARL